MTSITGLAWRRRRRFAETLARRLGLNPEYVMPAFEDQFYHLHQERPLPVNVRGEGQSVGRSVGAGTDSAKCSSEGWTRRWGWCCRCSAVREGPEWQTGLWMLRGQHLFLLPGDSPVGLRLPLPSLPWVAAADVPVVHEPDPMVARARLPVPKRDVGDSARDAIAEAYGAG